MALSIHRQKFNPQGRFVAERDLELGPHGLKRGDVFQAPLEGVSDESLRCVWKARWVAASFDVPVAPVAGEGGGSSTGGGPPRPPAQAPARRGR